MTAGMMRGFRRWYQGNRERAHDVGLLLLACALVWIWLFKLDAPGATWLLPSAIRPEVRDRLWLEFLLLFMGIFTWRRWREIDFLLQEAETDELTGLSNRRKIERVLAREFDRAMRYARPLSIVMIDVDHFKRVNDSYGHSVGDIVLMSIARRIRKRLRVSDHVGRWGGEEFILICPETDTTDAMLVADRIRRTIKQKPVRTAGTMTASFGVATYNGQGDYEVLIAEADKYLYAAKEQGRDRIISKFVLMAQAQLRKEGRLDAIAAAEPEAPPADDALSTIMSTIVRPLRRNRERLSGR